MIWAPVPIAFIKFELRVVPTAVTNKLILKTNETTCEFMPHFAEARNQNHWSLHSPGQPGQTGSKTNEHFCVLQHLYSLLQRNVTSEIYHGVKVCFFLADNC